MCGGAEFAMSQGSVTNCGLTNGDNSKNAHLLFERTAGMMYS